MRWFSVFFKSRLLGALFVCSAILSAPASAGTASSSIVILGDSISAGYGISEGKGWVALLSQKLRQEAKSWQVVNSSISGDTTSDALARFGATLKQIKPALVIIELGGNDGLRGTPPMAIRKNLLMLVELAQQHEAKVLLMEMRLPPNYGKPYVDAFVSNYGAVARSTGASLVPFFLADIGLNKDLMQADGIHPNERAQTQILAQIWPHLKMQMSAKP